MLQPGELVDAAIDREIVQARHVAVRDRRVLLLAERLFQRAAKRGVGNVHQGTRVARFGVSNAEHPVLRWAEGGVGQRHPRVEIVGSRGKGRAKERSAEQPVAPRHLR